MSLCSLLGDDVTSLDVVRSYPNLACGSIYYSVSVHIKIKWLEIMLVLLLSELSTTLCGSVNHSIHTVYSTLREKSQVPVKLDFFLNFRVRLLPPWWPWTGDPMPWSPDADWRRNKLLSQVLHKRSTLDMAPDQILYHVSWYRLSVCLSVCLSFSSGGKVLFKIT